MGYFTGHEEDRDRARRKGGTGDGNPPSGGSDGGIGTGFLKKCSNILLLPFLILLCMCAVHPSKSFDKKAWKNG